MLMCNVTLLNPEHQQLLYIKTDFFFSIQLCVSGSVSLFIGRRALVRLEGKKKLSLSGRLSSAHWTRTEFDDGVSI
jgi:hypothetical protein